jgi:thiol-disulfide isomerase/thioredoxin
MRLGPLAPWLILGLIALVLFVFFERRPREKMGTNHPAVGKRLTQFAVVPLTGNPPPITVDELPGRVTLINFWGTWCPPCVKEFPHLAALAKKFRGRDDFRFISVSVPGGDEDKDTLARATEAFLKAYEATELPTYADADPMSALAFFSAAQFEPAYPTTVILDRQGMIRGAWQGYEPGYERDMERLVEQLLQEKTN